MKFLHTSDWHLGRTFHGYSLANEQRHFCATIIQEVIQRHVNIVLISGDLYDRAMPSTDSIELFEKTIEHILQAGAQVFIISGNHDSRLRLGALGSLMEISGLHFRTKIQDLDRPLMLKDSYGDLAVYGIPYIQPLADAAALGVKQGDLITTMKKAIQKIKVDVAQRGNPRSLVLSHTFVTGGQGSESERDISRGGIENVPASLFEGFTYVALGHLHGQQKIKNHIRYSGSPLPYSFSEASHHKGYWCFEFNEKSLGDIEHIPSTGFRKLAIIKGTFAQLLTDEKFNAAEDAWCHITVIDQERPAQAFKQLKNRFPYICQLMMDIEAEQKSNLATMLAEKNIEKPHEVTYDFIKYVQAREPKKEEKELINKAYEAIKEGKVT